MHCRVFPGGTYISLQYIVMGLQYVHNGIPFVDQAFRTYDESAIFSFSLVRNNNCPLCTPGMINVDESFYTTSEKIVPGPAGLPFYST